jgi:hydroxylamine reductase
MFCYQCEQTAHGTGCEIIGVCGKTPEVAVLQDLLLEATKRIARHAHRAAELGVRDPEIDGFVLDALFTTVTNVNFDARRIEAMIDAAAAMAERARALSGAVSPREADGPEADGPEGRWACGCSSCWTERMPAPTARRSRRRC